MFLTSSMVQVSANQNWPIRADSVLPATSVGTSWTSAWHLGKKYKKTQKPQLSLHYSLLPFFSFETTSSPWVSTPVEKWETCIHWVTGKASGTYSHTSPTSTGLLDHFPTEPLKGRFTNELGLQLWLLLFSHQRDFISKPHFWTFSI